MTAAEPQDPKARDRTQSRQLGLTLASALVLLLAGIILAAQNEHAYRVRTAEQARVQADILAASVTAALAFDDEATVQEYVNALSANPEIAAASVYDGAGRQVVIFRKENAVAPPRAPGAVGSRFQRTGVVVVAPVMERDARLGTVYLRTAQEPVARVLRRHASLSLLVVMAILVIAAISRATAELRSRAAQLALTNDQLREEMTERAKAEEALRQSQKMESLGQLTGGVAHDFNNLLTVIIGGLETIGRRLPPMADLPDGPRILRAQDMAMQSAQRAATLTKRLLAFSRRQSLEPKRVEVNRMVQGMAELMRRTLGETVVMETVLGAGVWPTLADHSQLENVLLNLAVNARDAMEGGGKLTIETANAALDEAYVDRLPEPVTAGQYVMIAVTDTGQGMDAATLDHAFEPFFTTKDVGKGTGLGLSQVYGFVRQSGGHVRIYSEVGTGTTVRIYLPRLIAEDEGADVARNVLAPAILTGDESVLLVEDHHDLRAYSSGILRELGYRVCEAEHGAQALELLEAHPDIDLLFTDVVLPGGMNGRQLADEILRRRPGIKVLFTTGYTRNAIVHNGLLDPGVQLINKPFGFDDLAAKLRAVLDAG